MPVLARVPGLTPPHTETPPKAPVIGIGQWKLVPSEMPPREAQGRSSLYPPGALVAPGDPTRITPCPGSNSLKTIPGQDAARLLSSSRLGEGLQGSRLLLPPGTPVSSPSFSSLPCETAPFLGRPGPGAWGLPRLPQATPPPGSPCTSQTPRSILVSHPCTVVVRDGVPPVKVLKLWAAGTRRGPLFPRREVAPAWGGG